VFGIEVHKWRYDKKVKERTQTTSHSHSGVLEGVLVEEESYAGNCQNEQSHFSQKETY
jgi:hypothetical protein